MTSTALSPETIGSEPKRPEHSCSPPASQRHSGPGFTSPPGAPPSCGCRKGFQLGLLCLLSSPPPTLCPPCCSGSSGSSPLPALPQVALPGARPVHPSRSLASARPPRLLAPYLTRHCPPWHTFPPTSRHRPRRFGLSLGQTNTEDFAWPLLEQAWLSKLRTVRSCCHPLRP